MNITLLLSEKRRSSSIEASRKRLIKLQTSKGKGEELPRCAAFPKNKNETWLRGNRPNPNRKRKTENEQNPQMHRSMGTWTDFQAQREKGKEREEKAIARLRPERVPLPQVGPPLPPVDNPPTCATNSSSTSPPDLQPSAATRISGFTSLHDDARY